MPKTRERIPMILPLFAISLLFLWSNREIGEGIQRGLLLCYRAIIPSVFPFSVLSAYFAMWEPRGNPGRVGKWFERVFCLPAAGLLPMFIGLFCGFPLGAKSVYDGYRRGLYTKEEAEHLLPLCNNAGLSFLIGGVGASLFQNIWDGVALALIQLFSCLLIGLLMRKPHPTIPPKKLPQRELAPLTFPKALGGAVTGTLTVCGFVTFFSGILGLTTTMLPPLPASLVACFLEIGTACHMASHLHGGFVLCAFAVSFSGLSVYMQTAAILGDCDISLGKYIPMKLVAGCLSVGMAALYFLLFP